MNFLTQKKKRKLLHNNIPQLQEENRQTNFYYKDIAELTKAGGWSVDFREKKTYLDPQARKILQTPESYVPSLRTGMNFYTEAYKNKVAEAFYQCTNGT
ncbi:MAG: hypothetical protein JKY22_08400, partial [Flavobacteriaceae bacterium]|nr:hypothetical protein [Flavobacteriaceae bacterium]